MSEQGLSIGVMASGVGSNLQAIIDACAEGRVRGQVVLVISDKPQSGALDRARRHGIPTVHLDPKAFDSRESFDTECASQLSKYKVDLVVLAGYMRIVTTALIHPFEHRIINVHPSLLPAFPGMNAARQALQAGAKVAGCTVHFVDETLDQGPIIAQAAVSVSEDETETSLGDKIHSEEHRILPEAIRLFGLGRLQVDGRRVRILKEPQGIPR